MTDLSEPFVGKPESVKRESECLDWDDGGASSILERGSAYEQENGGLCVAICSMCAAIPALVGSWCWPILVGAIFAVAAGNVNTGLVDFFHGVQVAVMLALMTNITQFAYWKCKGKSKDLSHWQKYGPVHILWFASILVMVQPTCMLVIGSWDDIPNFFFDHDDQSNSLVPNTVVGIMIQVFCTYLGFGLMFWGVVWATNLHKKIARKWRNLRGPPPTRVEQ